MGHFHKLWTEGEGWEKICIKASENPRLDPAMLAEARLQLSPAAFARDYECVFVESEGAVFSSDLFKSLADNEPGLKFTRVRKPKVVEAEVGGD